MLRLDVVSHLRNRLFVAEDYTQGGRFVHKKICLVPNSEIGRDPLVLAQGLNRGGAELRIVRETAFLLM